MIAKGDGFASGSTLGNIKIVDIAPTILAHLGLPKGEKMEGTIIYNR